MEFLPSEADSHFWRAEIEQFHPSACLDDLIEPAVTALCKVVDPMWLRAEAVKPYRLGPEFLESPLHVVNGVRLGIGLHKNGPQRFARMLFLCEDHMARRPDIDFFSAALYVPELVQLGSGLDEIKQLGSEATRKLNALPLMTGEQVSATVFELLVGIACVRKGISLAMVSENRSGKVPDYQVTGFAAIQGAIECKRRLGLTSYEFQEAKFVEKLYGAAQPLLRERGIYGSIEACFAFPVVSVAPAEFTDSVLSGRGQW